MSKPPCENLHELQKLLDDELPTEQTAAIVAHVQTCQPCQHVLERLVTRPIGRPSKPTTLAIDETTDLIAPPAVTESAPQVEAADPTEGTMAGCLSSGETTDHFSPDASSRETEHERADMRLQDPDRTIDRTGQDNVATKDGSKTTSPSYRPTIPSYELPAGATGCRAGVAPAEDPSR
jgi:Putative zinc-finger